MSIFDRHIQDYKEKDFARQVRNQDGGIHDHEEYYIDKYLHNNLKTLEIGTGGALFRIGTFEGLFFSCRCRFCSRINRGG